MFEQTDVINAYWHSYIQLKQQVVKASPEIRPESEVYWRLGLRLGFSQEDMVHAGIPRPGESDQLLQKMLEDINLIHNSSITLEKLAKGPILAPGTEPIAFSDLKFLTPSKKIELASFEAAERWHVDYLPSWTPPVESAVSVGVSKEYPLQLLTPNTKNAIHSQFHNLEIIRQFDRGALLSISSADARSRNLNSGDRARVFNQRGELILEVSIEDSLRPGCVSCPNGYWLQNGKNVNVLSAGRETDMGFGAAFHDNLVQVEKWEGSEK